jgi:hypothetical protein
MEFDELDYGSTDIIVTLPSGASFNLLTEGEKEYFEAISTRYLSEHMFTNISDLQDVDRVVIMETMSWRWSQWLSMEKDWSGNDIEMDEIKKAINEYSRELRLLKKLIGIDKATRERTKGESFADYVETLRRRAREFGVMRNEQAIKAITLFQELTSLITLMNNTTPDEQQEQHCSKDDILKWIESIAIPEFQDIDKKFRETSQKFWIMDV